jgi:hypothetical protein
VWLLHASLHCSCINDEGSVQQTLYNRPCSVIYWQEAFMLAVLLAAMETVTN